MQTIDGVSDGCPRKCARSHLERERERERERESISTSYEAQAAVQTLIHSFLNVNTRVPTYQLEPWR